MNRSCKHSDLGARLNMTMTTSANAMLSHSSLSTEDRKSTQIRQMVEVPLFIKTDSKHNNDVLCSFQSGNIIQSFTTMKTFGMSSGILSLQDLSFGSCPLHSLRKPGV